MADETAGGRFEERLDAALAAWVAFADRRARPLLRAVLALTLLALGWAVTHLGVDSDNIRMLAERLPVRQRHDAFARVFPNLTNALLIVVDAPAPEDAREAARRLAERLAARDDRFHDVFVPGAGPYFERAGLLYRSPDELATLGDQIARIQPFLIALEREPTVANLARLVRIGLDHFDPGATDPATWSAVLDRIHDATVQVYEEFPARVSWEELLLEGSALETATRRMIVAEPVLDFDSVLPAAEALAAVRAEAAALGAPGVTVRVTGNPALNHEEMLALAWDVGVSGVLAFAAVAGILWLALRSWRLVAAALVTLVAGLVWTTAAAALTVGHLNLVSLTFAVLYIGLGIDFAIHLLMHYEEQRRRGAPHRDALDGAARAVGSSLLLCALTTTLGFFAFLPTDYLGVAELGGIAGTGMVVIVVLTLTLLPALLAAGLAPPAREGLAAELALPTGWARPLTGRPRAVRRGALLAGLAAAAALPALRFDPDVVNLRNPETESVQLFQELVAAGGATTPWTADVLAPDLAAADALAARLRAAPGVARAVTLSDYVPTEQEQKRELLADIGFLIDPASGVVTGASSTRPEPAEQVEALRALHEQLGAAWLDDEPSPLGASARRLRAELGAFLDRLAHDVDPVPELARLEASLLGRLPQQLERLRRTLDPPPITRADLPPELVRRMLAGDGQARVQVFAAEDLREPGALGRFADAVQSVAPEATGMAIDVVGFGRVISRSLIEALAAALLAIAALVFLLWRRLDDVLLVLAPLVLAGLLTGAAMVGAGLAFNFANVIVLPLLLGIGVDSGIHLVHRARTHAEAAAAAGDPLLASTTARAVFFSFATTMVSFGNLAFSAHRGIASLGVLLVVGMTLTMACNLLVLPALIDARLGRRALEQ